MLALGLDIGGANLKAATSAGEAKSEPFEIWRAPQDLAGRLEALIAELPTADILAVTMTAELADCFATKAEGVTSILAAVEAAAKRTPVVVWQTTAEFASPAGAAGRPGAVAAANWHALATWAGRIAPRKKGLLVDIGSTTTDIIPLHDGKVVARGATDFERLLNRELVYSGFRRTPLCAVADNVPVYGQTCAVAAELFATMLDVYVLLGLIPEDAADRRTADGRPATLAFSHKRLALMVCRDQGEIDLDEARSMARSFAAAQKRKIAAAVEHVAFREPGRIETLVISGSGEELAGQILAGHPAAEGVRCHRLTQLLSPAVADAACAYAVAVLATELK